MRLALIGRGLKTRLTEIYALLFFYFLQIACHREALRHFSEHVQLAIKIAAVEANGEMIFELCFFLVRERAVAFHAQYF
jgi:hypothetical protein